MTTGSTDRVRPIAPLSLPDTTPGGDTVDAPSFEWVDPGVLLVDEAYQRNLSEQSVRLIRRIVSEWSWRAFKPPVAVESGSGLHVIDGQHTAIAAATHPNIDRIPVMIVKAEHQEQRADAFVRHNRDRIKVTGQQLHYALVAAGNPDALTVQQVCERAGARILKTNPNAGNYQIGDTLAVEVLNALVRRRHAKGAREVVQVCVEGMMAPVSAAALRAVEVLLFDPEYAGSFDAGDLATTIGEMGPRAEKDAKLHAAQHGIPIWRGLVITLFKNTRRARRGHRAAA